MIDFPLCRNRHILRRHSFGNFIIPAYKGISLFCRVDRGSDRRVVILRDRSNFAAAVGVKGYCVLIDLPLCRDCHNLRGHLLGKGGIPADEGIALSRQGRRGDRCAIILVDDDILLTVCGLDPDRVRKDLPSGVQRHIPGDRVIKVPPLRAVGILIPAKEVVAFPYRLFIGSSDTFVLLFFARCRTGKCAAVRIERDRTHGSIYPHRIQGAVLRFVIPCCAVTAFIAVLPATPLLVKPAVEKISLVPRYRHLIKFLTVGDGHGVLRHRTAVGIESNGVPMEGPLRRQRDTRYGIVIRKVSIGGSRQYVTAAECPAHKIITGFCRIGNAV